MHERPFLLSVRLRRELIKNPDMYPSSIPAIRALNQLTFHPDVTFLVGENGAGKSTLLGAIALSLGFGPQGGTKNVQLDSPGDVSELHRYLHLSRSLA